MSHPRPSSRSGFTVAELIIGTALAGTILAAVLSSYLFLGRQFTRLMHQQTLEAQARRALLYLAQDTRLTSSLSGISASSPNNSSVKFIQTTATGTRSIYYYYNNGAAASVSLGGTSYSMPANSLSRVDAATQTRITLLAHLLTCYLRYYDDNGNPFDNAASPYTTVTTYPSGMSQISLLFTAQTGAAKDGTRTPVYQGVSARLLIRNRPMLY